MRRLVPFLLFVSAFAVSFPLKADHTVLEFTRFEGKQADPCHVGLNTMTSDCVYNQMPDPSVTVAAPSLGSNNAQNNNAPPALVAVILGKGFNSNMKFALSSLGRRCASTDGTLGAASVLATSSATSVSFNVPLAWLSVSLELEEYPRALCYSVIGTATAGTTQQWVYTGFKWKVVWACNNDNANMACPPPVSSKAPKANQSPDATIMASVEFYDAYPMNASFINQRMAKSSCVPTAAGSWNVKQCYVQNAQTPCGGNPINPGLMRCCNQDRGIVQWYDAPCPCIREDISNSPCPSGEVCCLPSKYPELSVASYRDQYGDCYKPATHQCCDTGKRFDPGAEQCCQINGVQSLNVPCPCSKNEHCVHPTDPVGSSNFQCCSQTSPAPWETAYDVCNKYNNYPSGTGDYHAQPCLGSCINTFYQVCCNGVACVKNTEYCCNSTCCNKYVGTCAFAKRPGAPGQFHNYLNFGETYQVCSTIEQMNTIRAFWVFVLPTELMFLTFVGLSIALAFAARSRNTHEFSILERVMIVAAVVTILFSVTLFFAPLWKYGVVNVLVSLLAIMTASARVRWLNVTCILLHVVALIYLFDFMHGNNYLMLPNWRRETTGLVDSQTAGILHTTAKMFKSVKQVKADQECTKYYNYFKFDPMTRDTERYDNPEVTTFGYCSRGWVVALYLFEGAILDLVLLQLVLDLLALIVRFKATPFNPIVVEQGKQLEQ